MAIDAFFLESLSHVSGCKCIFVRSISSSSDQILLGSDLALVCQFDCESQCASIACALVCVGSFSSSDSIFPRLLFHDPALFPRVLVVSWLGGNHLMKSQFNIILPRIHRVCSSLSVCPVSMFNLRNIFEFFLGMIFDSLSGLEFFDSYLEKFCRLPPCLSLCLVHGDLSPQNILLGVKSSRVGLIDWEYSGYAYRDFDLGWYYSVCSFVGCQDLRRVPGDFPNLNYFICFGYLRLAARIVRRRASFDLLGKLSGTSIPSKSVHQQQLDLIRSRLLQIQL